ncbi:hypothetical protein HDU85_005224 [Gaertneriomyces sp. JEL0708]|nr:hypothetical protein HDU85_005224 [Gaertneriomyces sp. JEL0708]
MSLSKIPPVSLPALPPSAFRSLPIFQHPNQTIVSNPRTTVLAITSTLLTLFLAPQIYADYKTYLSLGPAGLPHNIFGYFATSVLRLIKRETKSVEEYDKCEDQRSFLEVPLVPREGDRPVLNTHPVPQRQLTEKDGGKEVEEATLQILHTLHAQNPTTVQETMSPHEPSSPGLIVHPSIPASSLGATTLSAWREIGHVHNIDHSSHMVLSPHDCKEVISKGWGERHPCAGRYRGLPNEYLLVYRPRNLEEVRVVENIWRAAVRFATEGGKVERINARMVAKEE